MFGWFREKSATLKPVKPSPKKVVIWGKWKDSFWLCEVKMSQCGMLCFPHYDFAPVLLSPDGKAIGDGYTGWRPHSGFTDEELEGYEKLKGK